ncbi:MAG: hypothetical protein FWE88_07330 [Phycisphaerae bacterium]|nr:hypothetical protein [Phycisphaerae bacterium]
MRIDVVRNENTAGQTVEDILSGMLWRSLPQGEEAGSILFCRDLSTEELEELNHWTILEILTDCDAPLWALETLRDYGKYWAEIAGDDTIRTCGAVLHQAAVAAALLSHGQKITAHTYLHIAEQCRRHRLRRELPSQIVNLFEQVAFYCRPRIHSKVA